MQVAPPASAPNPPLPLSILTKACDAFNKVINNLVEDGVMFYFTETQRVLIYHLIVFLSLNHCSVASDGSNLELNIETYYTSI